MLGAWRASLATVQLQVLTCGRERLWWWLQSLLMTQQYCLASMASWLSSTGISHVPLVCLSSQQQPSPWNCSTIPMLQRPVVATSRGPPSLSRVWMAVARTVRFSFHLSCYRSAASPQSQMFLLWPRQLPRCGDRSPASVPPPTEGSSSPTNTPIFPPSSFVLWSFAWFYVFFLVVRYFCPLWLEFCLYFCVWRCIHDVSVRRDVLHVHLLLHRLAPSCTNYKFIMLELWAQLCLLAYSVGTPSTFPVRKLWRASLLRASGFLWGLLVAVC